MSFKKRFIALAVFFAVMIIGTVIYCLTTGGDCTVTMIHTGFPEGVPEENISYTIDDPSVAEVKDFRIVPNEIIGSTVEVTFHALKQGETKATLFYTIPPELMEDYDQYDDETKEMMSKPLSMMPTLSLRVNMFGTLIETNDLTFNGWLLIEIEILGSMVLLALVMMISFIQSMIKGRFSYSMVAFGGVALYCAFIFVLCAYDMQYMNTFRGFLFNISDSGFWFVILTSPFMLAFASAIAVSNFWLLRHEGYRPQNMLGIGLAVAWVLGLAAVMYTNIHLISVGDVALSRNVSYSLAYVLSFLECMLLSTVACTFLAAKYKPPHNKDYLMILGCCIRDDGTLTPILKGRVDAAIQFEREQFADTGKHAKFIPSGGQGADEVISEAEAMKRYLIEQGYPEEQIIKEDKSVNTFQNILFSRQKIEEDAGSAKDVKAAFATTNYHVFRGYVLSKKHGLDAQGISAKTKWYFYPNAFLREFAGLLVDKKWRVLLLILLILLGYTFGVHLLNMVH